MNDRLKQILISSGIALSNASVLGVDHSSSDRDRSHGKASSGEESEESFFGFIKGLKDAGFWKNSHVSNCNSGCSGGENGETDDEFVRPFDVEPFDVDSMNNHACRVSEGSSGHNSSCSVHEK